MSYRDRTGEDPAQGSAIEVGTHKGEPKRILGGLHMGQADAETLTSTVCVAHHEIEQKIAEGGEDLTSTDCVALWEAEQQLAAHAGQEKAAKAMAVSLDFDWLQMPGKADLSWQPASAGKAFWRELATIALAARPAAPEAQGAEISQAAVAALKGVHAIVCEAALTGFNCHDGDWAERLFRSQQQTSEAIRSFEPGYRWSPPAPPASSGQGGR